MFIKHWMNLSAPLLVLGLAACGGGGGSSGEVGYTGYGRAPDQLVPKDGGYVPVVVTNADNSMVLSAAHPSYPSIEFVLSGQPTIATDFLINYSGSINKNGEIIDYKPLEMKVISEKTEGTVDLKSNGGRPDYYSSPVYSKKCGFKVYEGWLQYNIVFPGLNQLTPPTMVEPGPDGICDTEDDSYGEESIIGRFFDSIEEAFVFIFDNGNFGVIPKDKKSYSLLTNLGVSGLGLQKKSTGNAVDIIINTSNAVVLEDKNKLILLKPTKTNNSLLWNSGVIKEIDSSTGWKSIGYDENGIYLYRNSSSNFDGGSWKVIKVNPMTDTVTSLGEGFGTLSPIMGKDEIWAQVIYGNVFENVIFYKNGDKKQYRQTNGIYSFPFASGSGRMIVYSVTSGYAAIEVFNENNSSKPYKTINNAYINGSIPTGTFSINRSPSTAVLYVKVPTYPASKGHAGGVLASYDPVSDKEIEYGTLPSEVMAGAQISIGIPSSNKTAFKSFALQSLNGEIPLSAGARKFSFQFGVENSLTELKNRVQLND